MKKLKPKPHQAWAWCSTLTILAGALAAAMDLYPYYCYIFLLGNSGLAIVSWLWKRKIFGGFKFWFGYHLFNRFNKLSLVLK